MDGDSIRRLREEKGLTQRELAERAGLSPSYVNEIENGRKRPSLRVLNRLAGGLGVPAGVLMGPLGIAAAAMAEGGGDDSSESVTPAVGAASTVAELGVGDRLRLARQGKGLTLAQLADKTGLSISYLSDVERGVELPAVETLAALATSLEVRVSDLVRREAATLGEKIRRLRNNLAMSRAELARSAGFSLSFIGQVEEGKARASLDSLERLSAALGVSPCYLILSDQHMEDMLAAMTPDLRRLLAEPSVQAVLRSLCDLRESELRFILQLIRLYKESLRGQ